ncbi:MAG: hypothetical protein N2Z76_01515 [Treponemataceae bacterium]|nr:hypothetical protein [Treponemataceae bacterium]
MRSLTEIERELAKLREELANVEGTPTEVYTRIVGYYRSVRNWNIGKKEEYKERRLFVISESTIEQKNPKGEKSSYTAKDTASPLTLFAEETGTHSRTLPAEKGKVLLFIQNKCPACPPAKAAVQELGIAVEYIDAGTPEGMERARQYGVYSTPTAILLDNQGKEQGRASDAPSIRQWAGLLGLEPQVLSAAG